MDYSFTKHFLKQYFLKDFVNSNQRCKNALHLTLTTVLSTHKLCQAACTTFIYIWSEKTVTQAVPALRLLEENSSFTIETVIIK